MLTTAFVVSVDGRRAFLRMPKPGGCGGSRIFAPKPHEFEAEIAEGVMPKPGDAVRLLLPTGRSIFSSFLIFILPLLIFLAVYLGIETLFPNAVAAAVLAGLAAAAAAMTAVLWLLKKSGRFRPTVTAVVDGFVPPECAGCAQGCFSEPAAADNDSDAAFSGKADSGGGR